MEARTTSLSGRKAEAARNDRSILDAARVVFIRAPDAPDAPDAPIAAIAAEAGVGVGALYRRYAGKEELLGTLCADGLRRFIAIASAALTDGGDPWDAFAGFLRGIVDSDVHSLTVRLAGTFRPTDELRNLAEQATGLANEVFARARDGGVLRPDLDPNDLSMLFEQMAAIRLDDPARTEALRHRYLALILDALRPAAATAPLPGPAPTSDELAVRWRPT